jgi:hypothetical protein
MRERPQSKCANTRLDEMPTFFAMPTVLKGLSQALHCREILDPGHVYAVDIDPTLRQNY